MTLLLGSYQVPASSGFGRVVGHGQGDDLARPLDGGTANGALVPCQFARDLQRAAGANVHTGVLEPSSPRAGHGIGDGVRFVA